MTLIRHGAFCGGTALMAVGFAGSWVPTTVNAQAGQLEEIVVTARRREENLQEIPVSVMAFDSETLELAGIEQIEDLNARVPNFSILGGGATGEEGSADLVMRAVEGVGVYIDGVWQTSNFGLLRNEFVEIDRVEVLRGPQGTLYGKNTTGGAINIITTRPADEFGARFTGTVGSYNRRDLKLAVDVPLSETVKAKFTGVNLSRDGFVNQVDTGRDIGDIGREIYRGDLLWTPSESFDVRVIYQVEDVEENGSGRVLGNLIENGIPFGQTIMRTQYFTAAGRPITNATQTAGVGVGLYESKSEVTAIGHLSDRTSASIDANWTINDALAFRSITGYSELQNRIYTDNDSSEVLSINDDEYHRVWQSTQEFQLIGNYDRFNWVGGLFAWDENREDREIRYTFHEFRTGELDFATVMAQCLANSVPDPRPGRAGFNTGCPGTGRPGNADNLDGGETNGWAIFGDLDIALTDQWTLTLGFRHQEEDLENWAQSPSSPAPIGLGDNQAGPISSPRTPYNGVTPGTLYAGIPKGELWSGAKGTFEDGEFAFASFESDTGRVSLQYQLNDDVMFYGGFSEGFTAGGANVIFPLGIPTISAFVPEELQNFELGLRSDWLDGRLRFNATLFVGDWTNIQLAETQRAPDGSPLPGTTTGNAAAADVSGSEFEIIWLPNDNWRFDINIGTLDTEYTAINESTRDVRIGDEFQQAPDLTYALSVQWSDELSNGASLLARLDYSWTDDFVRVRERDRQLGQEAYGLLNARVVYSPASGDWQASVFGTNLTDEWYRNSGFQSTGFGFDFATIGRPREAGVSMQFFFD